MINMKTCHPRHLPTSAGVEVEALPLALKGSLCLYIVLLSPYSFPDLLHLGVDFQ